MNQLVVNGIDFSGELPGEWTVSELVRVLETEVLYADEVVVDVTVDGAPFAFAPDTPGPRLEAVDSVIVSSRKVGEVVTSAIRGAAETARRFADDVAVATAALRVGRDADGWAAHGQALTSLRLFLDLAERLGVTLSAGLGPGPEAGARVRGLAADLAGRLAAVQTAADADDTVELCDALEDVSEWLLAAWDALWAEPAGDGPEAAA